MVLKGMKAAIQIKLIIISNIIYKSFLYKQFMLNFQQK